jgi:hypothetical protein
LRFPFCRTFRPAKQFAKPGCECFNLIIETGVLHGVGLRNTLEPDPDNTGVGSFPGLSAFFLESQREFSCFRQVETRGDHARSRDERLGSKSKTIFRNSQARTR